jgi:hypothetical protein
MTSEASFAPVVNGAALSDGDGLGLRIDERLEGGDQLVEDALVWKLHRDDRPRDSSFRGLVS